MMKKLQLTFVLIGAMIMFNSCKEEDFCSIPEVEVDKTQLATDLELIDHYIDVNVLSADIHSTGIRYIIHEDGNPSFKPTNCSRIRLQYEGRLLDGTVFDATSGSNYADFTLANLILGWQHGLQLIGAGGSMTLMIPSGYGYGSATTGSIPPNSVLIFEITLINVFS